MDPENINDDLKEKWELEQKELKTKLVCEDVEPWQQKSDFSGLTYVGGVDLSFVKGDDINACACLVVCSYPDLKVVYSRCRHIQLTAPYISGFLAFREVSFHIESIEKLKKDNPELLPQVIFVDGNGMLHPREFGIACHLGVITGMTTVGVAKKLHHVDGIEKDAAHGEKIKQLMKGGESFPLIGTSGKTHGMVLRVCNEAPNPVYVSVGHRISLKTAVQLVHRCSKHRIPEPIRQADMQSRKFIREKFGPKQEQPQRPPKKRSPTNIKMDKVASHDNVDGDYEPHLDAMASLFEGGY
ncbi:endonuclease V-like [Anneissia japonica]|uniref:endonuclease V-like n=1 Tax=Anneissia japonica TaxID=1529436 RepID=UPI0014256DFC|nr:endonuclease V-like [Anneissia japonica]XP_033107976.1 endonuclease V-like [Anneissia japonica]XP_033107977.1 endonuclease V-like [Anneissia japonica]